MTTVERARDAILSNLRDHGLLKFAEQTGSCVVMPSDIDAQYKIVRVITKALLTAMRMPTNVMHNAGALSDAQAKEPVLRIDSETGAVFIDWQTADPTGIWQAMIDAALAETPK